MANAGACREYAAVDVEVAEHRFWLRLFLARGVGAFTVAHLLDAFKTVNRVFAAGQEEFRVIPGGPAAHAAIHRPDLEGRMDGLEAEVAAIPEARIVTPASGEYPARLKRRGFLPPALFVRGRLEDRLPAVAVVGSRQALPNSKTLAREWCQALAARLSIISGLAEGIDAAAHEGALSAAGHTVAVLGTGLDKTYPWQHAALQDQILAAGGAVISQFAPSATVQPGFFPARNITMAALADAVLVVQAGAGSGALSTAGWAQRLGVPVLAVPSHPGQAANAGCLKLLKEGATLATSHDDVTRVLKLGACTARRPAEAEVSLSAELRRVFDQLDFHGTGLDELTRRLDMPAALVLESLLQLELAGLAARQPGPRYVRTQ